MLLILLFRHESEVDRLKSACVQAPVGLHLSLGPPAAADVGKAQWQFSTSDRFFVDAGTCASSNCSLYTTNGMLQSGFKPVDTNQCVCKEPLLCDGERQNLRLNELTCLDVQSSGCPPNSFTISFCI
ncbi:hypothetical protein AVEN_130072-1 [Araneus ventricosus]|uniref:Uncharacterized protein n=1 Tax=Araneus ventricosus TaxID=182803 RepID=A0A4Y2EN55_ARAVE|nr:hypothetical protein AVEN_130072-1 [Araneus ventricosus]